MTRVAKNPILRVKNAPSLRVSHVIRGEAVKLTPLRWLRPLLGKDETMRMFRPLLVFVAASALSFIHWYGTGTAFSLWMSGVSAGLFFGCGVIEGIGWLTGKPLWITIKPSHPASGSR